jgi:hypothetical protein
MHDPPFLLLVLGSAALVLFYFSGASELMADPVKCLL